MSLPRTNTIPTPEYGGIGSIGVQIMDPVAENELVLSTHPRRTNVVHVDNWDAYCAARQLPDDAGIWIERLKLVVTDWQSVRPTWYYLNHGRGKVCNLKMVFNKESCVLEWRAKRDIVAGEQLRFDYGIVPSGW